jgi:DNA-binding NarL/FixJ family response regulator
MTKPYSAQAILLDPSAFFLEGLEHCLHPNGHRVIARAHELAEAQRAINSTAPSLTLIGPHYTEFEGLALCRDILFLWPDAKLILYSRHAHDLLFQADDRETGL